MRRGAPVLLLLLGACSSGGSNAHGGRDGGAAVSCIEPGYPAGPYGASAGATLSDRTWTGATADGVTQPVSLHDALAGCPGDPPALVVRIDAAWCGTCRSYAAHARTRLLASDVGSRVRLFDVVAFDRDNAPASAGDAKDWQASEDPPTETAVDPAFTVSDLVPPSSQLPVMLVVDARTMTIAATLANPSEDALEQAVRGVLASVDGGAAPDAPAPVLADGRFTRDQWDLVSQMELSDPPAPDTSNQYADSIPAGALGAKLFAETKLSPSNTVACRSCHEATLQMSDGFPTSPEGVGRVPRNSPSLTLVAYTRWAFWDGRADSLWSQALGPPENANEFGSSRLFIAHAVAQLYAPEYETVFGPLPPLDDASRFPPSGKPGDPAYEAMAPADQQAVTQVFVDVGKAIEAYERTFRGVGAGLDAYAGGLASALTDAQKDGLLAFFQAGCAQCHYGPRLTDDAFHVLRFPAGSLQNGADPGRQAGIPQLVASDFDLGSAWSDDTSLARIAPVAGAWTLGAFKTPQIRNVALTAPYGHGGNYENLADVVELIRTGGLPAGSALTEGTTEPWVVSFDRSLDAPITTFLQSLDMNFTH
jgi:cytochrome c peroxidase